MRLAEESIVDKVRDISLEEDDKNKKESFLENEIIEKTEAETLLEQEVISNKLHPLPYLQGEPMEAVREILRISKHYSDSANMDSIFLVQMESDVVELAAWLIRGSAVLGECFARSQALEELHKQVKGQLAEKVRDSYARDLRPSAKLPTDKTIDQHLEASFRLGDIKQLQAQAYRVSNTIKLVLDSTEQLINALKKRIEGIRIEYRSSQL